MDIGECDMAMGTQSTEAESRCGAGHDPTRAAPRMGGRGERRDEKFEGRSNSSKQDLSGRRSETEVERRRGIVYRASGDPAQWESICRQEGCTRTEQPLRINWACELATTADAYSTQQTLAASRCEYGDYDLCMGKRVETRTTTISAGAMPWARLLGILRKAYKAGAKAWQGGKTARGLEPLKCPCRLAEQLRVA